jgi:putative flavoprotein involved in K+ transport
VALRVLVPLILRLVFHRLYTVDTPIGRKVRSKVLSHGMPLLRVKPKDLAAAGVEWVHRTVGVQDGRPVTADGRTLDVANVIWCTGYDPGFSWIDLPVIRAGEPEHQRGASTEPGLYFVGLTFLYAASSSMIHGVGRDAEYVANMVARRSRSAQAPRNDTSTANIQPVLRP